MVPFGFEAQLPSVNPAGDRTEGRQVDRWVTFSSTISLQPAPAIPHECMMMVAVEANDDKVAAGLATVIGKMPRMGIASFILYRADIAASTGVIGRARGGCFVGEASSRQRSKAFCISVS